MRTSIHQYWLLSNPVHTASFFYLRNDRTAEHVISDLELAILSVASLETVFGQLACKTMTTDWVAPNIDIRPVDGYFQWRGKHAYLTQSQLKRSNELYTIPFELKMYSVVSIQLQYHFILSDLTVLIRNEDSILVDPTRYGTNQYNLDDIKVYLSPGQYQIVISQTLPWPNTLLALPCTEFDLRITISNTSSVADRTDCTAYSTFPWDFNSDSGGSVPFGGPLRLGILNLFYDRFLLNSDSTQLASRLRIAPPSSLSTSLKTAGKESRLR